MEEEFYNQQDALKQQQEDQPDAAQAEQQQQAQEAAGNENIKQKFISFVGNMLGRRNRDTDTRGYASIVKDLHKSGDTGAASELRDFFASSGYIDANSKSPTFNQEIYDSHQRKVTAMIEGITRNVTDVGQREATIQAIRQKSEALTTPPKVEEPQETPGVGEGGGPDDETPLETTDPSAQEQFDNLAKPLNVLKGSDRNFVTAFLQPDSKFFRSENADQQLYESARAIVDNLRQTDRNNPNLQVLLQAIDRKWNSSPRIKETKDIDAPKPETTPPPTSSPDTDTTPPGDPASTEESGGGGIEDDTLQEEEKSKPVPTLVVEDTVANLFNQIKSIHTLLHGNKGNQFSEKDYSKTMQLNSLKATLENALNKAFDDGEYRVETDYAFSEAPVIKKDTQIINIEGFTQSILGAKDVDTVTQVYGATKNPEVTFEKGSDAANLYDLLQKFSKDPEEQRKKLIEIRNTLRGKSQKAQDSSSQDAVDNTSHEQDTMDQTTIKQSASTSDAVVEEGPESPPPAAPQAGEIPPNEVNIKDIKGFTSKEDNSHENNIDLTPDEVNKIKAEKIRINNIRAYLSGNTFDLDGRATALMKKAKHENPENPEIWLDARMKELNKLVPEPIAPNAQLDTA